MTVDRGKGYKKGAHPITLSQAKMNMIKIINARPWMCRRPNLPILRNRTLTNSTDPKSIASKEPLISKRLQEILSVGVPIGAVIIAAVVYEGEKIEV